MARRSVAIVAAAVLVSCQTYTVATEAPAEFWLTVEELLKALALDLWSLVELFL